MPLSDDTKAIVASNLTLAAAILMTSKKAERTVLTSEEGAYMMYKVMNILIDADPSLGKKFKDQVENFLKKRTPPVRPL